MSKQSALAMATGNPQAVPTPSLITPETTSAPKAPTPPSGSSVSPDKVATDPGAVIKKEAPSASPKTPDDDRLSIVIKKETEIFKQREQMKTREKELQAKQLEFDTVMKRVKDFEDLAKKDKIAAIKMLGWSDADIMNMMNAEPGKVDPVEEARRVAHEESNKLRAELTEKDNKSLQDKNTQLVNNFKTDITSKIKENASKFKFAAHEGKEAELQAYHIIVENLKASNELMSIEEALEITNDLYKDKYESGRKLFEDIPAPTTPPPTPVETARGSMAGRPPVSNVTQAPTAARQKTLSNAVAATSASAPTEVRMTREQKREKLIEAIKTHGLRKS